jgi:hypothetical protein
MFALIENFKAKVRDHFENIKICLDQLGLFKRPLLVALHPLSPIKNITHFNHHVD